MMKKTKSLMSAIYALILIAIIPTILANTNNQHQILIEQQTFEFKNALKATNKALTQTLNNWSKIDPSTAI